MRTAGQLGSSTASQAQCRSSAGVRKVNSKSGFRSNDLSSDTNASISLLRQKQPQLIARWRSTKVGDIALCSIVVYELRRGAESSSDPPREHGKLDMFLAPFSSLAFDDACAVKCAEIRRALEVTSGNKTAAARILGITRNGLALKMKRLGFDDAS